MNARILTILTYFVLVGTAYAEPAGPDMTAVFGGHKYEVDVSRSGVTLQARDHSILITHNTADNSVEIFSWRGVDHSSPVFFSLHSVDAAESAAESARLPKPDFGAFTLFIEGQPWSAYDETLQSCATAIVGLAAAALNVAANCGGPQAALALPCAAALTAYVAASMNYWESCDIH